MVDARMLGHSGIGTYLRQLLPRVIDGAPQGVEFEIIGGEAAAVAAWAEDPRVTVTRSTAAPYSIQEQVEGWSRRRRGDLYWSPHYNIPILRGRGRMLVTVHDLAHLALPEFARAPHRRAYARLMFRRVHAAEARIFDSRFTADEYARLVAPPRPGDEVIYPGVAESWFTIEKGAAPHPRPYLLFVGNVKPHKNLRGLLEAYRLLADEVGHDLVIVGRRDGFIHGDPEVVRQAESFGGRVTFTGWVDDARLEQYVAHADALVFPSRYEGFGLPPLEAMACGCPVVASRRASIPEVCGEAAVYCDPDDPGDIAAAIRRLLGDAVLRQEMIARGRERARQFTWERCAAATNEVIGRLL